VALVFLAVLEGKDISQKPKSDTTSSSSSSSSPSSESSSSSSTSSGLSSVLEPEPKFDRWCPVCNEGLHLNDLKSLRPSVTLNKLVSILAKNIPPKKLTASTTGLTEQNNTMNSSGPKKAVEEPSNTQNSASIASTSASSSSSSSTSSPSSSASTTSSNSNTNSSSSSSNSGSTSSGSSWWGQSLAPTLAWSFDNVKKGLSKGLESLANTPDMLLKASGNGDTPIKETKIQKSSPSTTTATTIATTSTTSTQQIPPTTQQVKKRDVSSSSDDTDMDGELEAAMREAVGSKGENAASGTQNESDDSQLDEELEELLIEEEQNNQDKDKV